VLHSPMLYGDLTARENLLFTCRMFRLDNARRRVEECAERMQVARRLDDRVGTLSHGLQKRVALARALLHSPRLLILDEPESGLDQSALALLDSLLDDYRRAGRAVMMTTHALERGLEMGDRVTILSQGRIAFDQPRAGLDRQSVREAYGHLSAAAEAAGA
jgi:ABC-type multidrug transport system ATPase subunit